MTHEALLYLIQRIVLPLLLLSVFLAGIRLLRGPELSDRVVALDLMATLSIGIIAVYALIFENRLLLDVAAVIALISFMGTIAFAQYILRKIA